MTAFSNLKISSVLHHARLLVAVLLLLAGGCKRSQQDEQAVVRNTIEKDVKVTREQELRHASGSGISLSGGDGKGNPLWKVRARSAEYSGSGADAAAQNARLTEAEAELYRNGVLESSFSASRIDVVRSGKAMRLMMSGTVHARTSGAWTGNRGPISLQTARAEVDIKTRRIWASQGVSMTQGTGNSRVQVSAREVWADTALRRTKLRHSVRANTGQGTITADAADWNWETGRAQATGKVAATHEATTISGMKLEVDTQARRGVLSGSARAVAPEGQASAGQVQYDWSGDKIVASGDVTLQKDGGVLRAGHLETNSKLNGVRAGGGVTLQKNGATLRAASARAFDQMTRATASGDVTLTRGDITMRADRVQATGLNDDNNARLSADGSVRVTQAGTIVIAEHAEASGLANKSAATIVATGGVKFSQAGKTVTASRVEATNLANKSSVRVTATGGVRLAAADITVNAARVEAANFARTPPAHIVATGGVVARSSEATVRAGRVQRENGRVVATDDVTLSKDGNILSGQKLESNDDFKTASLTGNVHAKLADGGNISAGVLRWQNTAGNANWESGRIQARDGVSMMRQGMKLRADQLDATANGASAVLSGNVVVTTAEGATLRAPSARYDKKTDKIYASGNVVYADQQQGIRHQSKTLIYDIKSKTAFTTEGRTVTRMDLFDTKKLFGTDKRKDNE